MDLIHHLHAGLGTAAGLVMALHNLLRPDRFISRPPSVRLKFGAWLAVDLEFKPNAARASGNCRGARA